ncbi:MAG: hypothetical protein PHU21_05765, partial [Elusimicrobia bacterium]|nr:hypothetical protein [Elusimicrobiota bacterium]
MRSRDPGARLLRVFLAWLMAAMPAVPGVGVIPAQAQSAPGLMNFQGRLTDSSNNPLAGAHVLTFQVFDAASGGASLWGPESQSVTVVNGVFAVQLGAVSALNAAAFSGTAAYLQVTVDGNPLTPRTRLITAPYAFNAQLLQGRGYAALVSTDTAAQSIAGDKTFTGTLSVPGPTAPGHAANKAYVDAAGGTSLLKSTSTWSGQNTFLNLVMVSSDVVLSGVLNRGAELAVGGPVSVAGGVTAASGTFTASGDGQFSLRTSSGVSVAAGGVTAPFFSGAHFGDGSGLSNVTAADSSKVAKAGDAMTGALTMSGSGAHIVSGSSITTKGGFFGDGSGLTNISATDASKVAKAGD